MNTFGDKAMRMAANGAIGIGTFGALSAGLKFAADSNSYRNMVEHAEDTTTIEGFMHDDQIIAVVCLAIALFGVAALFTSTRRTY